jgi:glutathione S-transferase
MTTRFELHGMARSGPAYAIMLMLRLCGEKFDYVHVNLMGGEQKTPEFLAKNRFGVVPALLDRNDGHVYVQSASILEHIADTLGKFSGKTKIEQVQMREWMFWSWDRLIPNIYRSRAMRLGFRTYGFDTAHMYFNEGNAGLKVLDDHLNGRNWIVGDAATYVDIALYGVLAYAEAGGFYLKLYTNIQKWMTQIEALPSFVAQGNHLPMESQKEV